MHHQDDWRPIEIARQGPGTPQPCSARRGRKNWYAWEETESVAAR